jgi:hypothetical protein|tara:strand:+ start:161 stop:310 length:150 start_codon:yes stop_codon:yes gene_type:complete
MGYFQKLEEGLILNLPIFKRRRNLLLNDGKAEELQLDLKSAKNTGTIPN